MEQQVQKFSIGDVVRVREYADMAEEFDCDPNTANIYNGHVSFSIDEGWQCGMVFTIASINTWSDGTVCYYPSRDTTELLMANGEPWMFTDWMLEYADQEPKPLNADLSELLALIDEVCGKGA